MEFKKKKNRNLKVDLQTKHAHSGKSDMLGDDKIKTNSEIQEKESLQNICQLYN